MGKHYSADIKKLIVACHEDEGLSYNALAERFKMPKTTVRGIIKKYEKTGSVDNVGVGGKSRKTSAVDDRQIIVQAKRDPFVTVR